MDLLQIAINLTTLSFLLLIGTVLVADGFQKRLEDLE